MLGHNVAFEISSALYPSKGSDVQTYNKPDSSNGYLLEYITQEEVLVIW